MPKTLSKVTEAFKAFPRPLWTPLGPLLFLQRTVEAALGLLAPKFCRQCDEPLPSLSRRASVHCGGCLEGLPWIERPCPRCGLELGSARLLGRGLPGRASFWRCDGCRDHSYTFDTARAALQYDGAVRSAIVRFKFQHDREVVGDLSDWAARAARDSVWRPVLRDARRHGALVPVPTHWWTRARRGWDPAHVLAREVGARLEVPVLQALSKTRATVPQMRLDRRSRQGNLRDAFTVRQNVAVPRTVILLDDVLTTGTTASRCAELLRRAGARYVAVLAVARS
jgi:competence protein ComFC